jgi:hypothetical protein
MKWIVHRYKVVLGMCAFGGHTRQKNSLSLLMKFFFCWGAVGQNGVFGALMPWRHSFYACATVGNDHHI